MVGACGLFVFSGGDPAALPTLMGRLELEWETCSTVPLHPACLLPHTAASEEEKAGGVAWSRESADAAVADPAKRAEMEFIRKAVLQGRFLEVTVCM